MNSNIELEAKVIQRFLNKSKQRRYLNFIKNEKKRLKFIQDLSHFDFLRSELFDPILGDEYAIIKDRILPLGYVKDCYVISENKTIDAKRLEINIALSETIASNQGTLLVFGNAELIYAEAEGLNNRWISK